MCCVVLKLVNIWVFIIRVCIYWMFVVVEMLYNCKKCYWVFLGVVMGKFVNKIVIFLFNWFYGINFCGGLEVKVFWVECEKGFCCFGFEFVSKEEVRRW